MTPEEEFQKMYTKMVYRVIFIPVGILLGFVIFSIYQLNNINKRIEEGQSETIKKVITRMNSGEATSEAYRQFVSLAILEEESLNERYRQGHYSLVSRSFKEYLGFLTGLIMVIVGSLFILLKLKENIDADVSKGESWKIKLVTSSPGVVFGIVGAVLIVFATRTNDRISVRDTGIYLTREYLVAPYFKGNAGEEDINEYMKQHKETDDAEEDSLIITHPPKKQTPAQAKDTDVVKIVHPPKK